MTTTTKPCTSATGKHAWNFVKIGTPRVEGGAA